MKINQHLRSITSGLCLLVLTSLAPAVHAVALAGNGQENSAFCGNVSDRAAAFQQRFSTKQTALTAAWQNQTTKLQTMVTNEDAAVTKVRSQVDSERATNQTALMVKAKTSDEKTAVQAYDATIATAVQGRRSAVDMARSTFRNSVTSLLTNRQAAASGRVSAFQITVSDAFTTAEGSCTDQTEGATVRASLLQTIAAARQTFEAQRTADTTTADLQTLVSARNQSIQAANNSFLQTTQTARQTLKEAFGDDASSI